MVTVPLYWTINAASAALGRGHRTVSKALRGAPPEGKAPSGHDGWTLATIIRHLGEEAPPNWPGARGESRSAMLAHTLDRLARWRDLQVMDGEAASNVPIDFAARHCFGTTPDVVLTWLRAGMPYWRQGNWLDATGFVLHVPWCIDWLVYMHLLCCLSQDRKAERLLRLDEAFSRVSLK